MAPSTAKAHAHSSAADTTAAVDQFMAELDHPFKPVVEAIRRSILDADPRIAEGIKWKSPSFRTHEYFATTNLREKLGVGVILHLGAKVRALGPDGLDIQDPDKLLKWLAADRAQVRFTSLDDFRSRQPAFEQLIRGWITHV